ncbi:MAG: ATP-binding protein [Saprospiraceae bacterium]
MTKQQKYSLLLTLGFFIAAFGFDSYLNNNSKLHSYELQIEETLHNQETVIRRFFENKDFIERQLAGERIMDPKIQVEDYDYISQLAKEDFTVFIYQNGDLLFWNNQYASNPTIPTKADELQNTGLTSELVKATNGYYIKKSQNFISKSQGTYRLVAMIPVKYDYSLESNYLTNRFVANKNIPYNISVSEEVSEYPIAGKKGDTMFYLHTDEPVYDRQQQSRLLFFYLSGLFLLIFFINATAKKMIADGKPLTGAAVFIVAVFAVRFLTILLNFSERFTELPVFAQTFQKSLISTSLGDLLMNIVLLLWIMFFFHKEFPNRSFAKHSPRGKFALTYVSYLVVLGGVLVLSWVFKSLIFNNNVQFDFSNTLAQSQSGVIAIFGIILLLLALFLFSHKMMLNISNIALDKNKRFSALGLAILSIGPIIGLADFMLPTIHLVLIAAIFVLLFDIFIDKNKSAPFTWLVIWLIVLSAFPSILLFKYNTYQDRFLRKEYAEELVQLRDKAAEEALFELKESLQSDEDFKNLFMPSYFSGQNDIEQKVEQYFYNNNYLFYNYDFVLNAYDDDDVPLYKEIEEKVSDFRQYYNNAITTNYPGLKLSVDQEQYRINYLLDFELPATAISKTPVRLTMRINRQRREQSRVYTELLVDRPFKNLKNLDDYEYAIYKNNIKIDGEGDTYGNVYNLPRTAERGNSTIIEKGGRSEIVFASNQNNVKVVIGKTMEEYLSVVSFGSYIFGALVLIILCVSLINKFFPFLPDTLRFSLFQQASSLKNRIQYFMIALTIISFIIIGIVTIWFFQDSSHNYHDNRLKRKADSVIKNAEHELQLMYAAGDSIDLERLIEPIARIHRIDINMYDLNGFLKASSEEDIFRQGVMEGRISAPALYALSTQKLSETRQENEHIGDLVYNAAYLSLNDPNGKTVAYLGLPYYSKQRALRSDVTVFMSTLLNVYVFLLLIAGAIAIMVAENITHPLVAIGDKMKQVKLHKRNEPLEYPRKDEIGSLVSEFNKMTRELENNALQLEQTAQEGAWREMAKQVAHEIKNPLTPMKLSIQYLLHAYQSNPGDIEPLLKRVANTLVEQIDNLSSIANEFSTFAKMPRAENQTILVNSLVGSVFELFSKESTDMMELNLEQPKEQFFVFADKNHLMRVLNNLIKNAIQAIPDDRKGKINVSLYKKHDAAIVKVSDNGTGISDDKKDKVFVPNFTTKNSGTGLGLAISKNIIESVSGRIWFETVIDVGTDFYIELPLVEINELEEAIS